VLNCCHLLSANVKVTIRSSSTKTPTLSELIRVDNRLMALLSDSQLPFLAIDALSAYSAAFCYTNCLSVSVRPSVRDSVPSRSTAKTVRDRPDYHGEARSHYRAIQGTHLQFHTTTPSPNWGLTSHNPQPSTGFGFSLPSCVYLNTTSSVALFTTFSDDDPSQLKTEHLCYNRVKK